jgi:FkbM family methyltransferase
VAETPATIDGMSMLIPAHEADVFGRFEFERLTRELLLEALQPGDVVIDVGAHVGIVTLQAARHVGPDGHVHSVEPTPVNADMLRRNIEANDLSNVSVHNCAAGSESGTAVLHQMGLTYLNSLVGANPYSSEAPSVEVPVRRLDDLVAGRVDAIKIDVEGAELDVLQGAERVLGENPHLTLCVEWNPMWLRQAGHDPLDLLDALSERGFQPTVVADESRHVVVSVDEIWPSVAARSDDHWWGNVIAYGDAELASRSAARSARA